MARRLKCLTQDYKRAPKSFYRRYLDGRAWSLGPEDGERPPVGLQALLEGLRRASRVYDVPIRLQQRAGRVEVQALREEVEAYRRPEQVPPRIDIPKEGDEV